MREIVVRPIQMGLSHPYDSLGKQITVYRLPTPEELETFGDYGYDWLDEMNGLLGQTGEVVDTDGDFTLSVCFNIALYYAPTGRHYHDWTIPYAICAYVDHEP